MGRIAVHGETPDMVVPGESISSNHVSEIRLLTSLTVGEVAYNSTITGITEYLPVSVSFIAAKGCVSALGTASWQRRLITLPIGFDAFRPLRRIGGSWHHLACQDRVQALLRPWPFLYTLGILG